MCIRDRKEEPPAPTRSHREPRYLIQRERHDSWGDRPRAPIRARDQQVRAGGSAKERALDDASQAHRIHTVDVGTSLRIQKARSAKKLTQAELAKLLDEKAEVIAQYENGKAVPTSEVLTKLEAALGARLRAGRKHTFTEQEEEEEFDTSIPKPRAASLIAKVGPIELTT
eukprot:TRINITY_DN9721_c0_g1_i3.p1 TRINITY_DN9721_c0_g1~~TRINITY_DN9721_c0_g1_i3.p1  ORF type:complete len:170 (+),score=57.65 TRINITY_DN9721_c0_g1_i3:81-590(+)